ncbi:MAG TPA: hypothetical protein VE870_03630 [Bacteroidales bacterium]|nr:hypothetical protein [Bacteroidales bacterium]
MRETKITPRQKRRELLFLLFAFIAANILNLVGILQYGTSAAELLTQLPVVLLVTLFLYVVVFIVRMIWWLFAGIYRAFNKF